MPDYNGLRRWIESELDQAAVRHPIRRTEPLHRLREEYQNAVRDPRSRRHRLRDLLRRTTPATERQHRRRPRHLPTHLDQYLNGAFREPVRDERRDAAAERQSAFSVPTSRGTDGSATCRSARAAASSCAATSPSTRPTPSLPGVHGRRPRRGAELHRVSVDGERVFEKEKQTPIRHDVCRHQVTDWEIRVPIRAGLRDLAVTFVQTTGRQQIC